ncbi:MAG: HAD-IC family P-type ATPase [Desulfobacteraceae bacterium]|jgi:Ca2+-transporting ATPase
MALIEVIHQSVTGRTRFRVNCIKKNPLKKRFLEQQLTLQAAISKISASELTGNVLVSYNTGNTPATIALLIEKTLTQYDSEKAQPGKRQAILTETIAATNSRKRKTAPKQAPPAQWTSSWHQIKPKDVLGFMGTRAKKGLKYKHAHARLKQNGPNRLPQSEPRTGMEIFLDQFNQLPVYLLAAAAGVSLVTGGILDAAIILGVVAANAVIGYATESKAESTICSLKQLVRPGAEVIRSGAIQQIPAEEVVLGDLLVLKPGMYVAADCRIIKASHLSIDESMLTGESMPVLKHSRAIKRENLALGDRRNMAYMGTLVTGGQGLAIATATGPWTEIGRLQIMLNDTKAPETPIERQLGRLGDQLVIICMGICSAVFIIGLFRGYGLLRMMRMAISLAAAAVPEGLPAAATINFAMGINRMRKHKVLIRHLQAVETLGAVQVVCLDKTGTLTQNRMMVQQVFVGMERLHLNQNTLERASGSAVDIINRHDIQQLAAGCVLCNETKLNGRKADGSRDLSGSSTEKALVHLALATGLHLEEFLDSHRLLKMAHRSESRLFMSTLHQMKDKRKVLSLKGSPPEVLAMCDRQRIDGKTIPLTEADRVAIETENERMAGEALRVLGFAYRTFEADEKGDLENGLIWVGLVGMSDPVRPAVADLIKVFHQAGVETVMITGDQNTTAYAVAKELDLAGGAPLEILDSSQFSAVGDDAMQALALKANVYSRVSPAHKLKIVQALQAAGKTVAMTGDGINDGPALKAADIGIAMGRSGTDVARDVADIILEDDQLEILTLALGDGRTIHGNIRKSVHFFLATNISEILLMFAAMVLGVGPPLTVMQLLWINLISDIFPGLALAMEPPEPDVMARPPRDGDAPLFSHRDFKQMVRESAAITGGAMAAYGYGLSRYGLGPQSSALAFQSLTIGQLLHAFSCRSDRNFIVDGAKPSNPILTVALCCSLALQGLTMFFPPLRSLLGLGRVRATDLAVIASTAIAPLLVNEIAKSGKGAPP